MLKLHLDPDPNASPESAPSGEEIAAANVRSGEEVVSKFEESVRNLTAELNAAAANRKTAEAAYTPPVVTPPVAAEVLTPDKLTQIATEQGFGPAAVKLVENVVGPMVAQTVKNQANQALRDLARDPVYGEVYRKNESAFKQYIRDNNINDAYIASSGGMDILKVVAFDDLADARAKAKADAAREKDRSALGTTGNGRPRSETVHTGPVGATPGSTPGGTNDTERAAALKINPRRIAVARERFGMSEGDLRKELLDMVKWEEKLGTEYVEQNGVPICDLADVMPTIGGVKVVPKEYFG